MTQLRGQNLQVEKEKVMLGAKANLKTGVR